ncbi:GH17727 [Drosophila grimshawi]|uniref:GH17727 n=1 Tax=Drosophila grimshawi TaxID=7222 RepID=B4JXQ2_DROGR|nr:GH17727 [Drosophila grimshawi]
MAQLGPTQNGRPKTVPAERATTAERAEQHSAFIRTASSREASLNELLAVEWETSSDPK